MQHRDSFIDALYGNQEDHCIPTEYDWFSPLLAIPNAFSNISR